VTDPVKGRLALGLELLLSPLIRVDEAIEKRGGQSFRSMVLLISNFVVEMALPGTFLPFVALQHHGSYRGV
jgi:hypothetical protein